MPAECLPDSIPEQLLYLGYHVKQYFLGQFIEIRCISGGGPGFIHFCMDLIRHRFSYCGLAIRFCNQQDLCLINCIDSGLVICKRLDGVRLVTSCRGCAGFGIETGC